MFKNAINRPLAVVVKAGAYMATISRCVMLSFKLMLPNVCRTAVTVPNKPSKGNHSAA